MKKQVLLVFVVVFVLIQFIKVEKNESSDLSYEISNNYPVSNELSQLLKISCYDCHSNNTRYPWYSSITPVNYWLADHVKDGKKHLNFSDWSSYTLKKKEHKMDELHEEVAKGEMPLDSYTWTHGDANLTQAQIDAIVTWGKKAQADYKQQMSTE